MPAVWELICHHTYTGIPGVIVDLSLHGHSHGEAIDLDDSDFIADGVGVDSGAIRINGARTGIHVATGSSAWNSLPGIKVEAILRREAAHHNVILDCSSFAFQIHLEALKVNFGSIEIDSSIHHTNQPLAVPDDQWIMLGFMHDGFGTLELTLDGEVVARRNIALPAIEPPQGGLRIGNTVSAALLDMSLKGDIDEIKIWRGSPREIYDQFHSRRMSPKAADCWREFELSLQAALRRHPECAGELHEGTRDFLYSLLHQILSHPDGREQLQRASIVYQRLWRTGQINSPEMVDCFANLLDFLRAIGLDISNSEFANSKCLQTVIGELRPLDCDRQFVKLWEALSTLRI